MKTANVLPDMVQVGNEITPGMIWPEGKIYTETGENWIPALQLC
jgi:arabinogalactan endo-1,4-beta-galactosidase